MTKTFLNPQFSFLLKPSGNLKLARALRLTIALSVALAVGKLTGHSDMGFYVGLDSLFFLLSDTGGFYSARAISLLFTVLVSTLFVALATLVSHILLLKLIFSFCSLFLVGYMSLYGHPGVLSGIVIGLFTLFTLNLPSGGWEIVSERVIICLIAGTWTIVLCLGIWPLNPYLPLKESISQCYQAIAKYINQAKNISESQELKHVIQLRETLQNARQAWTLDRKLRLGNTRLGESAIILIQDADNLITSIVTVTELVQLHQDDPQFVTVRILVNDALEKIASFCLNLVKLLWNKSVSVDTGYLQSIVTAIAQQKQLQQKTIADHAEDYPALVVIEQIISTLETIIIQLDSTASTVIQIKNNQSINRIPKDKILSAESELLSGSKTPSWFDSLRDNFTFDSSFFRHGLRLSIMTTIGVAIYSIAELPQGNWLTITILVVLQPSFGNTFQRFFHRMLGTILGAIVTPIFWLLIPSQLILQTINLSSIVIGFALIPFHYGLAVFFISIFAIGAEMSRQGGDWQVAMIRFLWTCVGSALAFVGAFLLFRPNEKEQLSVKLVKAIAASLDYFNAVLSVYLGTIPYDLNLIIKQRQKTRLAYFNAQAALQQLSSDPNTSATDIEPKIALLIYLHRFSRSVSVLLAQLEHFSGTEPHPELANFVEQVNQFFLPLISSILTGTLPPASPTFEPSIQTIQTHLQTLQVTRLQEFAADQNYTPTRQILKDYTILGIELNQMLNSLNSIDSTVVRLNQ
ncbi:putative protein slr1298 [Planktothrix rubescens]|nr:putative protein slr1298 [Planktothrix rubescens]